MQNRMRTHPLKDEEIEKLLQRVEVGSLATINLDGTPYSTPIHFIYFDDAIFVHGLSKGKKIDNILNDSRVGFSLYEMEKLILDPQGQVCDTNTKYESIIISGTAKILEDIDEKKIVLEKIVKKYTPHLVDNKISNNMLELTAVIRIDIVKIYGKYYS